MGETDRDRRNRRNGTLLGWVVVAVIFLYVLGLIGFLFIQSVSMPVE